MLLAGFARAGEEAGGLCCFFLGLGFAHSSIFDYDFTYTDSVALSGLPFFRHHLRMPFFSLCRFAPSSKHQTLSSGAHQVQQIISIYLITVIYIYTAPVDAGRREMQVTCRTNLFSLAEQPTEAQRQEYPKEYPPPRPSGCPDVHSLRPDQLRVTVDLTDECTSSTGHHRFISRTTQVPVQRQEYSPPCPCVHSVSVCPDRQWQRASTRLNASLARQKEFGRADALRQGLLAGPSSKVEFKVTYSGYSSRRGKGRRKAMECCIAF